MKNVGKIYSRKVYTLVLLLLLFTFYERIFVPSSALAPVEQDILLGMKEVWNDPDLVLSSWTKDNNCSDWNGITCDENGHVIELSFEMSQFSSFIPSSIGNLTSLEKLNLKSNSLFGPIPDSFRNLMRLTYLDLSYNNINGSFPSSILTWKNIQILYLGDNKLQGPLPPSIGNLNNLVMFYASNNQLYGLLPSSIDNLTNLVDLRLDNNKFSGPIPSIGNLTNLLWLGLSFNNFNGPFPSSILTATKIKYLILRSNQLNGPLPSSIGNLINLLQLNLDSNNFNGPLPSSIGNLINLIQLTLDSNKFYGPLPSSIGNLINLVQLNLFYNQFFGPIPPSIAKLTNLSYLDLSYNKFNGSFPSFILTMKNIQKIYLDSNRLNGPLPSSIGNLINLVHLGLSGNQFVGRIPSSIGNLTQLEWLFLGSNSFFGPFPSFLINLTNLNSLWLHSNQLSGPIPPSIGLKTSLDVLYLDNNYFTGNPITCVNECNQKGNCLKGISEQKSNSQCSSFCGANSVTGPCGGHGTCAFNASNIPICTCDSGWFLPNCQQNKENSISHSSSPSPSPSPSPSSSPSSPAYTPFPSSHSSSKSSNNNMALIFGITVPIVIFLIIFAIIVCLSFKRLKKKEANKNELNGKFQALPKKEFENEIQRLRLKRFSLREIHKMTRGFDASRTLGRGGFGTVYKGIMPSGELCAIKKAHRTSVRSLHDFQKEVFALAQINHFNIVKLLGCCNEANENILIYEYVANGSLSKMLLLPKDHPHFLSFKKRVQIARDCALGLHYLHNLSNKQLIHRDVKSDNILLDAKFTAKIADFGLLKVNDENLSTINTSPCGTLGYVDPEYHQTLTLTNKSDVYSFGVVLLELITGKRSIFEIDNLNAPNGKLNISLVLWARPILQSSNWDELIDPNLKEEHEPAALQSLASLAASCLRQSQKVRPGMDEVSSRLGVIMYGKATKIQEDENYAINMDDYLNEFSSSNDGNTNSSISNKEPVMSKSFKAR